MEKKKAPVKGTSELKEISFSMKISGHDIETKLKQGRSFLEKGHKLRFNLILRGRERAYADTNGLAQIRRLTEMMKDIAVVEQMSSSMIGNRLFAILAPVKVAKATAAKAAKAPANPALPTGPGTTGPETK